MAVMPAMLSPPESTAQAMLPPPESIAYAISTAPAWALVSLTMPDEQLRESGAQELARWIVTHADQPTPDARQLGLPL